MRWLLLLLPLLSGCFPTGVACTTEARASVQVSVIDEEGTLITDADVTWTGDDGIPTSCENMGGGDYVCGYEAQGELTIDATKEMYEPGQEVVTVTADECHVITEVVRIMIVTEPVFG